MPSLTVKKTREGPDQEVQEEMVEIRVPNEVFAKILMKLDGRSLHTARQVCKEWNSLIESQVLGTVEGRRQMERTLQLQWREAAPARSEVTIGGFINPDVMALTDQLAVIRSDLPSSEMSKVSLVNTRDGVEVPGLSCSAVEIPAALLTKDVLLLAMWDAWEWKVLAWNINTKAEIFKKTSLASQVVLDRHNQQVMMGRNIRLEISGTTVTEISQTPLPGVGYLKAFSHPSYLSWAPGGGTLLKLNGTQFTKVGDLGFMHSVLCLAGEILVHCSSPGPGRMRLRVWCKQTGQLTKDRVFTLPTPIISYIAGLEVYDNQLVVDARQQDGQDALLVFELDTLLSQSADQQIAPRRFLIGQPGSYVTEIYLSKTKVTAGLPMGDAVKFISMDFWNAEI